MAQPNMYRILFLVTLCLSLSLGCSSEKPASTSSNPQSGDPSKTVTQAKGPSLKDVGNSDYTSWSQFPIGTKVVRRKTMSNEVGTTVITTTLELKEIKAEAVMVESQITVKRTNDTTENPPSVLEYPKSQKIPAEMDPELFTRPLPDANKVAAESIESMGNNYDATVYEWKAQLESGPMKVKGWFSDKFPGRQIKLEFENPSGNEPFVEEIIELNIPKS
jgi:hypothetical protein